MSNRGQYRAAARRRTGTFPDSMEEKHQGNEEFFVEWQEKRDQARVAAWAAAVNPADYPKGEPLIMEEFMNTVKA